MVKTKVYAARFNLSNVFMSEDFTPRNQQLINELISLKKAKHINKFWSIDGKIFAKAHESQSKTRIIPPGVVLKNDEKHHKRDLVTSHNI